MTDRKKEKFTAKFLSGEGETAVNVHWIEIQTPSGSVVIGPDHTPYVSLVKPESQVTYEEQSGQRKNVPIQNGFVVVENGEVSICTLSPEYSHKS
ncbi:hypothetical protein HOD08_04505 [bacterium]|nr:hypothetical protein [bacterium]